jgi:hypothetical protein
MGKQRRHSCGPSVGPAHHARLVVEVKERDLSGLHLASPISAAHEFEDIAAPRVPLLPFGRGSVPGSEDEVPIPSRDLRKRYSLVFRNLLLMLRNQRVNGPQGVPQRPEQVEPQGIWAVG